MVEQADVHRYLENWRDEVDSAFLYRALAEAETQPALAEIYRRLAASEENHAQFWTEKLTQAGRAVPRPHITWRTRVMAHLARWFGPQFVLPTINAMEQVNSHLYDIQADTHLTPLPRQERSHARLLQRIRGMSSSGLEGTSVAQIEGRHRTAGGNTLRAAVLGANDGLLSNFSLVMGVAGADASAQTLLITGLAGLLAGACSMALGEWLSVQSSRELYDRQIRIERQELEEVPEEEEEELALIYEAKGLPASQARALAAQIMQNQSTALDTLSREELGIDPEDLGGSAWAAAITSFLLFAIGAAFPVLPFAVLTGWRAIATSVLLSGMALFLIGAGITLMTGRGLLFSGLRQVVFGFAAAGITFAIGRVIGVSLVG